MKNSLHKEKENKNPIGAIQLLSSLGKVIETMNYNDEKAFIEKIEDASYYGIPTVVIIYKDSDGNHLSTNFVNKLDPPPLDVIIKDCPKQQGYA